MEKSRTHMYAPYFVQVTVIRGTHDLIKLKPSSTQYNTSRRSLAVNLYTNPSIILRPSRQEAP